MFDRPPDVAASGGPLAVPAIREPNGVPSGLGDLEMKFIFRVAQDSSRTSAALSRLRFCHFGE
jgi:hypothetical protein